MKNKNMIIAVLVVILVGAGSFVGGMQFQKGKAPAFGARGANGNQRFGARANQAGGGAVNGEIISQDDSSVTVKSMDGSSKIIVLSDKTVINKASTGTKADLKTGERVTAFGMPNSDGSVTATNISIGGNMFRINGQASPSGTPAK